MPSGAPDRDDLSIADALSSTLELERRIASTAPAPLREKLRTAPISGERKPVTALFADVVGSTALAESMDPEEWIAVVTQAFEVLAEAAYRYEGTVAQLLGDGLLAFFGAPLAHEDDPERAIRAGLDMVGEIEALGEELDLKLRIRVGINTGLVVVGNVGNDLRYEYTAIGDAVNVAARLQAAASPGSVLVTEETYRLARGAFEVVDLGGVEMRGRSEAVRAYDVVGVSSVRRSMRGIPGLASPMIGRNEELARLEQVLEIVRAGRGRFAVVVGEPGIGKTRLLGDLRANAGANVSWFEAQCVSYGARLPYGLVLDLVRSLVRAPPAAGLEHVAEALDSRTRELLGADAGDVLRYLRHLLGLPAPSADADALGHLDPERLHAAYVDALRQLVAAEGRRRPVALVCEDLHWADPASVATLRPLLSLAAEAPLLFLLTCRPDRDVAGWQLVLEARETYGEALTEIVLSPLSGENSRTLVANLLRIESLPDALRRLILDKGEGNPFFLEEVIRMLVERGAIERRGEDWVAAAEIERVEIPTTLHGLLLARIDRLPEDARRVLRVASAIGRRFAVRLLESVVGREVGADVSALESAGLVRLAATAPGLEYEFRHALVHEAAYDSLLKGERRRLHRAAGEALERLGDTDAALLAFHFERAGDDERATRYRIAAGTHALERFAYREASEFFQAARTYLEGADASDPELLRLRVEAGLGLARAAYWFAPLDEGVELLDRVLADAERLGDSRLEAHVNLWLARTRHSRGETPETSESLARSVHRVRELGEELDDDYLRAHPLALDGAIALWSGRFRRATETLGPSARLLERHGDLANASYYAGLAAVAYARLGEFAQADEWLAEMRRLVDASGDVNSGADASIFAANVEGERGNLVDGIRLAWEGAERAAEVGNAICEAAATFFAGDQELRRGSAAAAIPALERSDRAARSCGAASFAELSGARLTTARSQLGDPDADLDEAVERVRALGDAFSEAETLRDRAVARSLAPDADWDAVVDDFETSLAILERLEARPAIVRTLHAYGAVLQRAGRDAEAGEKLARAMALSAELGLAAA